MSWLIFKDCIGVGEGRVFLFVCFGGVADLCCKVYQLHVYVTAVTAIVCVVLRQWPVGTGMHKQIYSYLWFYVFFFCFFKCQTIVYLGRYKCFSFFMFSDHFCEILFHFGLSQEEEAESRRLTVLENASAVSLRVVCRPLRLCMCAESVRDVCLPKVFISFLKFVIFYNYDSFYYYCFMFQGNNDTKLR